MIDDAETDHRRQPQRVAELATRVHSLEQQLAPQPMPAPVPAPMRAPMPRPVPASPAPASPVPPPIQPMQPSASTLTPEDDDDSLESRIGSRWLLYVGVVAIIIGVSYFEKLAVESRWIGETARVIQGAIFGVVLVGIGLRFARAGYQLYGRVLSGCGIAVLYVSTYAAFNLYHLINRPTAFGLMSLVTLMAALLADRQRAQNLAIVAISGGFATPFLIRRPPTRTSRSSPTERS